MPIYMDRHDLPVSINAEEVARLHQEDLKIEAEFGCKGLTYWYDDHRKLAFCLIEAPDQSALQQMHNHAHGAVPNSIIEVNPSVVSSFLGRISDPEKASDAEINVIDDPAFRVLTWIDLSEILLAKSLKNDHPSNSYAYKSSYQELIKRHTGSEVERDEYSALVSFAKPKQALDFAIDLQAFCLKEGLVLPKIGISSGVPFEREKVLFESTVKKAERLSKFVPGKVVLSNEVQALLDFEQTKGHMDAGGVLYLSRKQEHFFTEFLDFLDAQWRDPSLKLGSFEATLGLSKAQLYRKTTAIFGASINVVMRNFRLDKAKLELLRGVKNISEIAYECGFNSPGYFSRCFGDRYGMSPSDVMAKA